MGAWIVTLLLLFQATSQSSAQQSPAQTERQEAALHSVPERLRSELTNNSEAIRKNSASVQERLFVERFNRLIYTLSEFANDYKTRQTIDVKKAKAVSEAWRKLEKAQALFQDSNKK